MTTQAKLTSKAVPHRKRLGQQLSSLWGRSAPSRHLRFSSLNCKGSYSNQMRGDFDLLVVLTNRDVG